MSIFQFSSHQYANFWYLIMETQCLFIVIRNAAQNWIDDGMQRDN